MRALSRPTTIALTLLAFALIAGAVACHRQGSSREADFDARAATGEWILVELDGERAPPGAGDRPATIQFDPDANRAAGFAGCNQYTGPYSVSGDSLHFGPMVMTKMACAQGMELETKLAAALEATQRYTLDDRRLTLLGTSGPVARFERR